ncbi:hypothetical protein [Streptomyces sp. NPDC055912]|uniref:hypothetical protein n=1 Tax=unclassified Streptomyces TaxID=2593676 RepID=UPI0035DFBF41
MTDEFDARLDEALESVRSMLPEGSSILLEDKLRHIHSERPDLDGPEVIKMAFDVLEGEKVDALLAIDEARARVEEADAAAARNEAIQRIAARSADLDAVEARHPGRATLAEALADAGISWAYLGLSEEDGLLAEEVRREFRK